ncbi:MAG: hypothetical protein ACI8W8_001804 [Rhodothermales bacterium]|jgi:hypothetical protein
MGSFFNEINNWVAGQLPAISTGLVAALLVLYGGLLHQAVRRQLKNTAFALRLVIFIVVCIFGYGLISVLAGSLFQHLFASMPRSMLIPALLAVFTILGLLAERKRHM